MARAKNGGNGRLEEAMAVLIQSQASFVAELAEINRRNAETDRHNVETDRRMLELKAESDRRMAETDRINSERFGAIEALLLEHNRILQALPDAIREKIGFKIPKPPA